MSEPTLEEPVYKAVERILDEHSAWIARPDHEVTKRVSLAATIAAHAIIAETRASDRDEIATLEAENARLREALEAIGAYNSCSLIRADATVELRFLSDELAEAAFSACALCADPDTPTPGGDEKAALIARIHELAALVGKKFTPDPVKLANWRTPGGDDAGSV